MNKVLLVSEDYIKTNSALQDNIWGKFLLPAIREAQDINLQSVLGTCLYKKLLSLVNDNTISFTANEPYKVLLDDYIQNYLLYQIQANIVPIINIKMGNIGSVVASDEYIQTLSQGNVDLVQHYFQDKADFYCRRMQEHLINYHSNYPELDECACSSIKANLKSTESSGIWLGGVRGRKVK